MYTIKLQTFNGQTKEVAFTTKGQVANFINQYPSTLPIGVSVRVSCDVLGVSGILRGVAK